MGSVNTVRDAIEELRAWGNEEDGHGSAAVQRAIGRCFDCRRDAETARSCTTETITFPDGTTRPAVQYGERANESASDRCVGCGVSVGGFHHPFCPIEPCPQCGGRLATCSCLDSDKTR